MSSSINQKAPCGGFEAPGARAPPPSRVWGSRDDVWCAISFFYQVLKCIFMSSSINQEAPCGGFEAPGARAPPIAGEW